MDSDTSDSSYTLPDTMALPNSEGVGLSSPHLEQSRRQMLDLVNRLHNTGVNVDIDLPLIAVIGQQSAGKSSLIESISGITLPRAAGTCTRCPTECRLSYSSKPWTCTVSIRMSKDGGIINKQFGDVISDQSQVEERIRKAQSAILNPQAMSTLGMEHFLSGKDDNEANEKNFSSDLVSLDISGPNVSDLSFCDLPGLIAGVGQSGNTDDIESVKSLVGTYIERPSCIILLTVACETDFQNQGAQELAKVYDPLGKRTIGVLTKPDRIPAGEEGSWISLIRNERESLENGWYCVKQPSSADLARGITWAQARQKENKYFESTAAWQNLDPIYQKYLRTANLVERLSSVLSDLILNRLPEIQHEIAKAIEAAQDALNNLPSAPSSDARSEISGLLHKFAWDLSMHMQGVPDKGIIQAIRPAQNTFRLAIRQTSPEFQPFYKHQNKRMKSPEFLTSEDGDGSDDDYDKEEEEQPAPFSGPVHVAPSLSMPITGREIYIDEVLRSANQARTRELPGNYPYIVQVAYIKSFVKQWRSPAKVLSQFVGRTLEDYVLKLVHKHFKSFGQGQLEHRVMIIVQEHLKNCLERTEERIEGLFELENEPFTLNTHYLMDYRNKFLSLYHHAREKDRNPRLTAAIETYSARKLNQQHYNTAQTGIEKVLSGLTEIGFTGVKPEQLANIIEKDGTEPALFIMANVRAYYQVAYKRFVDNVPLVIDHGLVRGVERDAMQVLNSRLGINGPDGLRICQELAQENPKVAARREELSKKLERLQAASRESHQIIG